MKDLIMKELRFASDDEALRFLATLLTSAVRVAAELEDEEDAVGQAVKKFNETNKEANKLIEEGDKLAKKLAETQKEARESLEEVNRLFEKLNQRYKGSSEFGSADDAIQYLSDLTGFRVIIKS